MCRSSQIASNFITSTRRSTEIASNFTTSTSRSLKIGSNFITSTDTSNELEGKSATRNFPSRRPATKFGSWRTESGGGGNEQNKGRKDYCKRKEMGKNDALNSYKFRTSYHT